MSQRRVPVALVTAATIALIVAAVLWATWPRPLGFVLDVAGVGGPPGELALPDKPSIVVLPLANMTGDPEQEYFADGLTEELTASLSGNPLLFVISRNSAFSYKGRPVRIEDVGRELGVRYVVEGSVRRAGDRVRITAQLIDATSGVHIWSQQFDRDLEDIFAVQSEISEAILGAVGVEVREAELARIRRRPTEDLSAYEAYSKAYSAMIRYTREDLAAARRLLERAIELDPGYVDAQSLLGATYSLEYGVGWSSDRTLLDRAMQQAEVALALDPNYPGVHILLASVNLSSNRPDKVITHARKAIAVAPSFAPPHAFLAVGLAQSGQPLAALRALSQAIRLDPRVGETAILWSIRAGMYRQTGRIDEAVDLWERAREANADLILPRLELADHYSAAGRLDEARVLVREIQRVRPELTAAMAEEMAGRLSGRRPEEAAVLAANLRTAGLP